MGSVVFACVFGDFPGRFGLHRPGIPGLGIPGKENDGEAIERRNWKERDQWIG